MALFAPVVSLGARRRELMSRLHSALAPVYDARRPFGMIRDRIADRAGMRRDAK